MTASQRVVLQVCTSCRDRVRGLATPRMREGFVVLPDGLCAECEAKIAQCTRLLLSGGAITMEPEAEAGAAAAPQQELAELRDLLKEGRAALVTYFYQPPAYGQFRTPLELQQLQARVDAWIRNVSE